LIAALGQGEPRKSFSVVEDRVGKEKADLEGRLAGLALSRRLS
jgi:hypothetical protein